MIVDERLIKRLLWVAILVFAMGVYAFVIVGAGEPADPYVVADEAAAAAPPGDPARTPLEGFGEVAVTVRPARGSDLLAWCLLAALQAEQRARGLMQVTDLQGYSGMVFVYDEDVTNAFYMRNTPTPLSIAWIASDGTVVSTADMEPCEDRDGCPTYQPAGPYRTAIEVFQGGLDELGITAGATVTVGGPCAPRATPTSSS